MDSKRLIHRFYDYLYNYNLFIPENLSDGDNTDTEHEESSMTLKQQKYSTWLYIFLLIVCLYTLFSIALINLQIRTTIDSNINPSRFDELYHDNKQTLLCPCTKAAIPLKSFVKNTVQFHPVCSSIFVSKEWIDALYSPMASRYTPSQFEKTASYQFQMLSDLCSLSRNRSYQTLLDIDSHEFATVHVHTEEQVRSKIIAIIEFFKNSASTQIISFLNYSQDVTRVPNLISALNTNALVEIVKRNNMYDPVLKYTYIDAVLGMRPIRYFCSKDKIQKLTILYANNITSDPSAKDRQTWSNRYISKSDVLGFYSGCFVFEAISRSTLTCLYNQICLEYLFRHSPDLKKVSSNWTEHILYSNATLVSVKNHLNDLFIYNWSTKINYLDYFHKCAPSFCTFTKTNQKTLSDAIALFISLYGGLIIILRLITKFLVNIVLNFCHRSKCMSNSSGAPSTIKQKLIRSIKSSNMFKNSKERTENDIKQQQIMTYVRVILIAATLIIIFLFNCLHTGIMIINEEKPSLIKYSELHKTYSESLKCPCSTMVTPYAELISLTPTYHQVCSSDFVDERWLKVLKASKHPYVSIDGRNILFVQFNLLSTLCKLADEYINGTINQFMMQSLLTSNVLTEKTFKIQLNTTLNQFFQSTKLSFSRFIRTEYLILDVNQPYTLSNDDIIDSFHPKLVATMVESNRSKSLKLTFRFSKSNNNNSTSSSCICAIHSHCENLIPMYDYSPISKSTSNFTFSYWLPGWKRGCSTMDSLVLTDLQCLYSHTDCLQRLILSIKATFMELSSNTRYWFEPHSLIYNSTKNRFHPNTSIEVILGNIMLEDWNASVSYENFYKSCSPISCTYLKHRVRTKTIFQATITLISLISAVATSIYFIIKFLAKLIIYLWKRYTKKQTDKQNAIQLKLFDRLKLIILKSINSLYKTLINLNIFLRRDFSSDTNLEEAKYLGQWSTRLYILLFILCNLIFILYTVVQSEPITKLFDQPPSFDRYNHLRGVYGEKLKCPCSNIASKYETFLQIQPKYHPICSSSFVSNEWRINLTIHLISDLFIYEKNDYRLFLVAHLKYLKGLCSNSIEIVENTINELNSSLLITNEILLEKEFHKQINSIIEQTKSNAPLTYLTFLSLIRLFYHNNAYISKYQTNHQYIVPWNNFHDVFAPTEPVIYENNCTCGLNLDCVTQAGFYDENLTKFIPIKGIKMGCLPSESFRLSTLECFYDEKCLNSLHQMTNTSHFLIPLSLPMNKSWIHQTIDELIHNLFIETWSINLSYSSYFHQCFPSSCSYIYSESFNIRYIITFLLGLQGGLTIVLRWICPKIIQILFEIHRYRKKRSNLIHTITMHNNSIVETTLTNQRHEEQFIRTFKYSFKFLNVCILYTVLIIFLIVFYIFILSKDYSTSTTINNQTTTTEELTAMTAITTSTTPEIIQCEPSFETKRIEVPGCSLMRSKLIGDFNNDHRDDFAYFCDNTSAIHILLGDPNDVFRIGNIFKIPDNRILYETVTGDINNDNKLDLICLHTIHEDELTILYGDSNATFIYTTISIDNIRDFVLFDMNYDNYLDLVGISYAESSIVIYLGNGQGGFVRSTTLPMKYRVYDGSLTVDDLNHDNYLDIVVTFGNSHEILIYLGSHNGTFEKYKEIRLGFEARVYGLHLVNLNNDAHLDILFSYNDKTFVKMFGYGNGDFSPMEKFTIGDFRSIAPAAVNDMNCDEYSDIIIALQDPPYIGISLGTRNANYHIKSINDPSISEYWKETPKIMIHDLNKDHFQDILAFHNYYSNSIFIFLNTCQCCLTGVVHFNNLTSH
ncbi:unnamed protein product [Adineta ricciae]|uniref:Uncharacterized protein n=1 Tax=Adineta ricciae TaxID=249248 RepID=A0A815KT86_ADIRI|nr:unnamed protein product [Adineta ricciae]CAF1529161.1 unnamed protein product [Adineta ricciae]